MLILNEGIVPTCACASFGLAFIGVFIVATWYTPPANTSLATPAFDTKHFRPVVLVTIGWSTLYYCFLQGQSAAAFWVHKLRREEANKKVTARSTNVQSSSIPFAQVKYGREFSSAGLVFTMDRSVGNLLEQSLPFLLALWLNAFIVSPVDAAGLGWSWLFLRALYPIAFAHPSMSPALWGLQRQLGISWITFVTWPSYFIVWSMLIGAARACF